MLLCPQSSGRWSRRRAARAERRDRTRRSPAEMTSTSMTTRSALGQVSTQSERAAGVGVCGGDKGGGGGEQLDKEKQRQRSDEIKEER